MLNVANQKHRLIVNAKSGFPKDYVTRRLFYLKKKQKKKHVLWKVAEGKFAVLVLLNTLLFIFEQGTARVKFQSRLYTILRLFVAPFVRNKFV